MRMKRKPSGSRYLFPIFLLVPSLLGAAIGFNFLLHIGIPGEAAGDNFGTTVAGAGDLNGDGFDDLAAGAPFNDDLASAAGRTYVYFGGQPFDTASPLELFGDPVEDDHFGIAVGGAGDVDGDGFVDLVVGARFNDRGGSAAGAAFLFLGGSPMDSSIDAVFVGDSKDDWFGQSVAGAGDVNGDGFSDILVGAPFNDESANAAGKAYIFFGGNPVDPGVDVELFGDPVDDGHFGWSVAGAGDVNGDGYDDVIVGARLFGFAVQRALGRAYIFLGGPSMDGSPDIVLTGEARDDWFGEAVAGGGDVNGDGFSDVLVGAIYNDDGGSAAGKAYLFFGGPTMDAVPDWTFAGEHPDSQLGNALAGAGDFDGDGFADVLVASHLFDNGLLLGAGKVYLFHGGDQVDSTADWKFAGRFLNDHLGHAVAGAGDLTGNLSPDLAIGVIFNDEAGSGAGKVRVVRTGKINLTLTEEPAGVRIGWTTDSFFDSFNLYWGSLGELGPGDFGSCLAADLTAPEFLDPTPLIPGEGVFYLVSGLETARETNLGLQTGANRCRTRTARPGLPPRPFSPWPRGRPGPRWYSHRVP